MINQLNDYNLEVATLNVNYNLGINIDLNYIKNKCDGKDLLIHERRNKFPNTIRIKIKKDLHRYCFVDLSKNGQLHIVGVKILFEASSIIFKY